MYAIPLRNALNAMHHLIASYLFQNKTCPLPGLGTLSINTSAAEADFTIKQIAAPKPVIQFDDKGKRTKETIGTTMRPYDFMSTNDATGTFDKSVSGITFSLDKLNVSIKSLETKHNLFSESINNANAKDLINWGKDMFADQLRREDPLTPYDDFMVLKSMSGNGKQLDFKSSLGLPAYTALEAGHTSDGKPVITTLRAVGNIIFGANMHSIIVPFIAAEFRYKEAMKRVGEYNQTQNGGNGYNAGYPYYGEHTYSGSYIYYGYFGSFFEK